MNESESIRNILKDCDDITVLKDIKRQIKTGDLRVDDLPIMGGSKNFPLKGKVINAIENRIEGIKAKKIGIKTIEPQFETEGQRMNMEEKLFKGSKEQLKQHKRDAREFLKILIEITKTDKEIMNLFSQ